ncbi:hypothetical protein BDV35DRAFT_404915 [Aspergillus flavus]|uniref:Gylcosyl hydrolase 115 C-terminal domain-containing protein n=1 Tax=Aspergillus flavus TaxID=5059 RepID=A0A5N6GVV7_ASPFL|nr:hypothetical protein BDV35DRAFT_404915 [Aspergillus flavus]
MRPILLVYTLLASLTPLALALSRVISFTAGDRCLQLGDHSTGPDIWVAPNDWPAVRRAAGDLATDFGRVLGQGGNGTVLVPDSDILNGTAIRSRGRPPIIVGTIGNSSLIDGLVSRRKISEVVSNPVPGVDQALVIAGSDRRGTIFGMYDVSETIGVSPWYWWADVPPQAKDEIYAAPGRNLAGEPSVKYRGIFINDEELTLQPWAATKYNISQYDSPFTGEFTKRVLELLLRNKANYYWPAMKQSMFYVDDPQNGIIAEYFGVVMGTSHTEPMTRATDEQSKFLSGSWDWTENSANVTAFMAEGVNRSKAWDTLYTMGMRGSGDTASPTLTAPLLEQVIQVQQGLLEDGLSKSLGDVPQLWALYKCFETLDTCLTLVQEKTKEVGQYWQAGMNVSDLVTLLWTDDNYGNLLRVPYPNETTRAGGAGVYYHVNYVGRPRSYRWINTIQLIKIWDQMHTAYVRQASRIWVLNVGALKPLEIPQSYFLDMAYNMSNHLTPDSPTKWMTGWAERQFGSGVANMTAYVLNKYGLLTMRRKYEHLTFLPFVYSTLHYDEGWHVLKEWEELLSLTQAVYDTLDPATQIAYYQPVLHPVLGGKTVEDLYIKKHYGDLYKAQGRASTNHLAAQVWDAWYIDGNNTQRYNTTLDGRWKHIMDQKHIGYNSRNAPTHNIMPNLSYVSDADVPASGSLGVSIQGSKETAPDAQLYLLSVDPYMPPEERRYIDVVSRANGTFSYVVHPNTSYVSVSNAVGKLSTPGNNSDARCVISVDWNAAPSGLSWVSLNVSGVDSKNITLGEEITVFLPVNKTSVPRDFSGYVESNGVVSIEAAHYAAHARSGNGVSVVELPYYGRTLSGIKLWPVDASSQTTASGPKLTYNFYTFSSGGSNDPVPANFTVYLGGSRNYDATRPIRYAFALDGGSPIEVLPVPSNALGSDPAGWNASVVTGGWNKTSPVDVAPGAHSLDLWLLEPSTVIQKLVLDLGGQKDSGLGPPESFKV